MEQDSSDCLEADVEEITSESSELASTSVAVTKGRKAKVYEYFEEQETRFMCKTCR